MQQIQHGVVLSPVISRRRIHGHAAFHLQCGAVIPHLCHIAVGHIVHAIQIALVPHPAAHDEDVLDRSHIAVYVDIRGVEHLHPVHPQRIGIQFGGQRVGGEGPHTVGLLQFRPSGHLHLSRLRVHLSGRQEIARHLHLHRLWGIHIERNRAVGIHHRRVHLATAPQRFLAHRSRGPYSSRGKCNNLFSHISFFLF